MTVHISAARTALDRMMSEPAGVKAVHSVHQGLRTGRWSKEYVDSIGQHGVRSATSWPMEQVAAFAEIHAMITSGLVAMVPVSTGAPPRRDVDREANAAALANLPHPFTASVNMDQQCGDFDGTVEWSEPIGVSLATRLIECEPGGVTRPISVHYMIPPGDAPLEIGSSLPSRTLMHLAMEGGSVARWPYGQSRFRLFVNLDYVAGIERMASGWQPKRFAESEATRKERAAVRRACAALGHPRALTYAEVAPYRSATLQEEQQSLW